MTEKEKMLQQMLYDANYDIELINEKKRAKSYCYEYNNLHPDNSLAVGNPCKVIRKITNEDTQRIWNKSL